MRYEFWKAGNDRYSADRRLSVSLAPHGQMVAGYVCSEGRGKWAIEGDTSGQVFKTAEDAADALIREQDHVALNETESRVVEILTSHPRTHDHWTEPIHAVDRAMGWATADTRKFVEELVSRRVVIPKTEERSESLTGRSRWWWERGGGPGSFDDH